MLQSLPPLKFVQAQRPGNVVAAAEWHYGQRALTAQEGGQHAVDRSITAYQHDAGIRLGVADQRVGRLNRLGDDEAHTQMIGANARANIRLKAEGESTTRMRVEENED